MLIELKDVILSANKEKFYDVCIEMDTFSSKLGDFPIIEKNPFSLQITNQENKRLMLQGSTDVTIAIPCDRCLEDVPVKLTLDICKKYLLGDAEISEESMEETDQLTGTELNVDSLIYDEILVNWPMKVLCREDCKGICKKCGINLNKKTCDCPKTELDPRMAAIQDVFNKFKEV